ncbi:MAG: hypothetical protein JXL81_05085 [Deltaproteobacteria bacterium]|nr:hypothetical protein [Deltaproteobacteria bacterium]
MKINESQRMLLEQQGKINKNRNTDTGSFQQIMDQMTSTAETKKTLPSNINPVQIIDRSIEITPVNGSSDQSNKTLLLDSLKDTLNLIDFYAGKLADKTFPAEKLSSLVEQLDEKLASIKDISSMEGVPEQLKPVISDMAVTIGTEIERYRRGDYV